MWPTSFLAWPQSFFVFPLSLSFLVAHHGASQVPSRFKAYREHSFSKSPKTLPGSKPLLESPEFCLWSPIPAAGLGSPSWCLTPSRFLVTTCLTTRFYTAGLQTFKVFCLRKVLCHWPPTFLVLFCQPSELFLTSALFLRPSSPIQKNNIDWLILFFSGLPPYYGGPFPSSGCFLLFFVCLFLNNLTPFVTWLFCLPCGSSRGSQ